MGRPGCSSCCEQGKEGCTINTYSVCYLGGEDLRCEREDPDAPAGNVQDQIGDYIESLVDKQFQYGGFDIPNVTSKGLVEYNECKSDYAEYSSYGTPWLFPVTFLSPELGIAHIDKGEDEDGEDIEEGANFSPYRNGLSDFTQMVGTHVPQKWTIYLKSLDENQPDVIKIENEWDGQSDWDNEYLVFVYQGEKYGFGDFQSEIKCSNGNALTAEIPKELRDKWQEKYKEAINPNEDPDMETNITVSKTVFFRTFYRRITGLSKKKKFVPVVIKFTLNNDGSPVDLGIPDEDLGRIGRIENNEIYLYCWDYDDDRKKWLPLNSARRAMAPYLPGLEAGDAFQTYNGIAQTSFDFLAAGTYDEFAWCLTYPFMTHTDGFGRGEPIEVNQSGPRIDGVKQMTNTMPLNDVYEDYEQLLSGQVRRGVSITDIRARNVGTAHFSEDSFKCIAVESEDFVILNPYVKNMMIKDEWFEHYDYEYPTLAEEDEQRDDAKLRDGIVNKYTDPKLTPVEKPEKPERDDFPEGDDGDEEFEEAMEQYEDKLEEYNKYLEDLLNNYKILKRRWGDIDFGSDTGSDESDTSDIFTYRDVKINLEKDIPQTIYTSYAPLGLWNDNATPVSTAGLNDPNKPQSGTIDAAVGGGGDPTKNIKFPRQEKIPNLPEDDSILKASKTIEEYQRLSEPLFRHGADAFYLPQKFFGLLVNGEYNESSGTQTGGESSDRLRDIIVVKSRSMRAVPEDKIDEMLEHGLVWFPIGGCDLLSITDSVIGVSGQPESLTLSNGDECTVSDVESATDVFTYAMGDSTYQLQTSYLHGMFRNPFYYKVKSISLINPERDVYPDHEGFHNNDEVHIDDISHVEEDLKRGSIVITHDGKEHLNPTRIKLTTTSSWTKLPEDERCPEEDDDGDEAEQTFAKVLAYSDEINSVKYAIAGGRECAGFLASNGQDFFLESLPLHNLKAEDGGNTSFGKICSLSDNTIVVTPRVSFGHADSTSTSNCCEYTLKPLSEEEPSGGGGIGILGRCEDGSVPEEFFGDNVVYPTSAVNIMKIYREIKLKNNFTFDADGKVETQIETTFKGSQKPNFGYLFGTYLTLEFELEQLSPAKDGWGT